MSITFPNIPRRVVTGHLNGVATIVEDNIVKNVMKDESGFIVSDPWASEGMPAKFEEAEIFKEFFPKLHDNGSLFRYVVIPPDSKTKEFYPEQPDQPHHLMHTTQTLDYVMILSGEVYLVMENCETLLKPGDIVIQTGTSHAWSNRTEEPVIQWAVLLDAAGTGRGRGEAEVE